MTERQAAVAPVVHEGGGGGRGHDHDEDPGADDPEGERGLEWAEAALLAVRAAGRGGGVGGQVRRCDGGRVAAGVAAGEVGPAAVALLVALDDVVAAEGERLGVRLRDVLEAVAAGVAQDWNVEMNVI